MSIKKIKNKKRNLIGEEYIKKEKNNYRRGKKVKCFFLGLVLIVLFEKQEGKKERGFNRNTGKSGCESVVTFLPPKKQLRRDNLNTNSLIY